MSEFTFLPFLFLNQWWGEIKDNFVSSHASKYVFSCKFDSHMRITSYITYLQYCIRVHSCRESIFWTLYSMFLGGLFFPFFLFELLLGLILFRLHINFYYFFILRHHCFFVPISYVSFGVFLLYFLFLHLHISVFMLCYPSVRLMIPIFIFYIKQQPMMHFISPQMQDILTSMTKLSGWS